MPPAAAASLLVLLLGAGCPEGKECGIDHRLFPPDGISVGTQCRTDDDCDDEACDGDTHCNTITELCEPPGDAGPDE